MERYHSVDHDPPPLATARATLRDELELLTKQYLSQGKGISAGTIHARSHQDIGFNNRCKRTRSKGRLIRCYR